MKITKTAIEGLLVIEPSVFEDKRGYFFESYNEMNYKAAGITNRFVQDNQSKSAYGVIRGLHMQLDPFAQAKLIRVLEGAVFDVAVDVRKNSPTFGKWFGMELSAENKMQMLVPKGCCHGFSVISETAIVFYKCDEFYKPGSEAGIRFDDPDLGIDWRIPADKAIVSEKDTGLPFLKDSKFA